MSRRTRLRHRLYAITAINAVILLGLTALLTYRAWKSHVSVRELVVNDGAAIAELQQLQRSHSGFVGQWQLATDAASRKRMAARYTAVLQLVRSERFGATGAYRSVRDAVEAYATALAASDATEAEWHRLSTEGIRVATSIDATLNRAEREFRDRLPAVEETAHDTMYVAIGVVYIIVIFSFAVAKQTLTKVVAPIEKLAHAAEALKDGELGRRVPLSGDHEVADLTRTFNEMSERLKEITAQLEHQASTDELTRLPNFRAFQSVLDAEIERASRYEEPFGVLVFDIDHFKRYNDSFGHAAGNEVLCEVAAVIRKTLRVVDTAARYGGEEFVAVVPRIDARGLLGIAERVRRGAEALPAPKGRLPITISAGGAIFPDDGADGHALFAAADSRLYAAKEGGRNRVVIGEAGKGAATASV